MNVPPLRLILGFDSVREMAQVAGDLDVAPHELGLFVLRRERRRRGVAGLHAEVLGDGVAAGLSPPAGKLRELVRLELVRTISVEAVVQASLGLLRVRSRPEQPGSSRFVPPSARTTSLTASSNESKTAGSVSWKGSSRFTTTSPCELLRKIRKRSQRQVHGKKRELIHEDHAYAALPRNSCGKPSSGCGYRSGRSWCGVTW